MSEEEFKLLIEGITQGKLQKVDLQTKITLEQIQQLANALTHCDNKVNALTLTNCHIDAEGIAILVPIFQNKNNHIHYLDIGWNALRDKGVIDLADSLVKSKVRTLKLNSCQFGIEGLKALVRLSQAPGNCLDHLDISSNQLENECISVLKDVFSHKNSRLRYLILQHNLLSSNQIFPFTLDPLIPVLENESSYIPFLDLSHNRLNIQDMFALIRNVGDPNNCIHSLILEDNNIDPDLGLRSEMYECEDVSRLKKDYYGIINLILSKARIKKRSHEIVCKSILQQMGIPKVIANIITAYNNRGLPLALGEERAAYARAKKIESAIDSEDPKDSKEVQEEVEVKTMHELTGLSSVGEDCLASDRLYDLHRSYGINIPLHAGIFQVIGGFASLNKNLDKLELMSGQPASSAISPAHSPASYSNISSSSNSSSASSPSHLSLEGLAARLRDLEREYRRNELLGSDSNFPRSLLNGSSSSREPVQKTPTDAPRGAPRKTPCSRDCAIL